MSKQHRLPLVMALALVASLAARGLAQQRDIEFAGDALAVERRVELMATVTSVDHLQRRVELEDPEGRVVAITVSNGVRNLHRVEPGDKVRMHYLESLALSMAPASSSLSREETTEALEPSTPGTAAGGLLHTIAVVARIAAVAPEAGIATLVGPGGQAGDVGVPADLLAKLKIGDLVRVVYTEALTAALEDLDE